MLLKYCINFSAPLKRRERERHEMKTVRGLKWLLKRGKGNWRIPFKLRRFYIFKKWKPSLDSLELNLEFPGPCSQVILFPKNMIMERK